MVEIYSALIFYLLVRIVIAIAAKKSGKEITDFSFKTSAENLNIFFYNPLKCVIPGN